MFPMNLWGVWALYFLTGLVVPFWDNKVGKDNFLQGAGTGLYTEKIYGADVRENGGGGGAFNLRPS